MPKPPDKDSKTLRLVLEAHNGEADKIRAFKEICARNGLEVRKVLLEKVDAFLREHNWPPGNSQTLLKVFSEEPRQVLPKCKKLRHKGEQANYRGWCKSLERWVTEEKCLGCVAEK